MTGSSIVRQLRDAPWLTPRRLAVYPKLFAAVYAASILIWLLASKGLVDPGGHPIGADFIDPWSASWLALHGAPGAVYDVPRLWAAERAAVGYPSVGFAGFHYAPTYLVMVLPLALLPYVWSLIAWTIATDGAYLAVMRKIDPERASIWLAIAFPGALVNLTNGQNGFLTLSLFGGALLSIESRPIVAGVLFGLMSYKPQYGALIPLYLLATRRWRTLIAASVTVILFVAVSLALFGTQTWADFFTSITFTRHVVLEQGGSGFEKLQSAFAAARLWGLGVNSSYALQAAVSLLAAIVAAWIWWRTRNFELHAVALVTATLLITPYMMDYDLVMLALPVAWLALEGRASGFLPWEKSLLVLIWLLPLFARTLAGKAMIPISPLVMLLLLAAIARRSVSPIERFQREAVTAK